MVEKIASLSKKPIIRLDLTQSISEISNCEMILDNNYLDFKSIINILATKKSDNITFKILPKLSDFLIGSNNSNDRGEVLTFDN